jgi:hypothetical protein
MDDFLYNLRRDTDKRNRRQSGQQQYRGPDRRGPKDPRRNFNRRNENTEQLSELLPEIKSLLETMNENQKQLLDSEKKKQLALENIAASLRLMSGNSQSIEVAEAEEAPVVQAAEAPMEDPVESDCEEEMAAADENTGEEEAGEDETSSDSLPRSSREEIRKIALALREQGKTYKEIAQHLDEEQIPTFSGKGGWHAPTIHKLCK